MTQSIEKQKELRFYKFLNLRDKASHVAVLPYLP